LFDLYDILEIDMEIHFDSVASRRHLITALAPKIAPHITTLRSVAEAGDYNLPESSINLPTDEHLLSQVETLGQSLASAQLRYVFLVGIGGSYLGAKAIYDALYLYRDVAPHTAPRLICVDTTNPTVLEACYQILETITDPQEYAVVIISKSGGTTETIANAEVLLAMLDQRFRKQADRVCVVSDEGSSLLLAAQSLAMHTIAMPRAVGGRYSVFSAVGLVPLQLCGVPIRELHAGAAAMVRTGTHHDVLLNPAAASALARYQTYLDGRSIHDWFAFHSELATVGAWWRQLVGESIGKTTPQAVVGITPTVSIGSNDLHSVGQLYFGGPKDKYLTFIRATQAMVDYQVPSSRIFPASVPDINGHSLHSIMDAIIEGTKAACQDRSVSYMSVTLQAITPRELGAYMQFAMLETMYLGKLLAVNPFDQPDVEAYKVVTKERLRKK
jgi:glucose-6-phosphate isomerase